MNALKREYPTRVGIALGSNLGNRLEQFRAGLEALRLRGDIQLLNQAAVYETDPVDCPPGSQAFLNTVIEVESSLDAHALHQVLQQISKRHWAGLRSANATRHVLWIWTF